MSTYVTIQTNTTTLKLTPYHYIPVCSAWVAVAAAFGLPAAGRWRPGGAATGCSRSYSGSHSMTLNPSAIYFAP